MALFLIAFLAFGPISVAIARYMPKSQFFPSFIAMVIGGGGVAFIAWILLLALTFVVGRLYCSTLCPLGILQDVFRWISRRFRGSRRRSYSHIRSRRILAYSVLIITIATLIFGSTLMINLLEPYRVFGMFTRDFLTPIVTLAGHGVFALLKLFGIFTSPPIVPIDGILFIMSFLLISGLFVFVALRGRLFCNTLCPTGAALSIPASWSLYRIRINSEACTSCGKCERVCKAGCIDSASKAVDFSRCVSCFSCLSECSFDAIGYRRVWKPRRNQADEGEPRSDQTGDIVTRRGFLHRIGTATRSSIIVFPLSFLFRRRRMTPDLTPQVPVTPPGSRSISRFRSLCISCHLCVSRCPTGVLQPSLLEYGAAGIMQPSLDFAHGFCEYECNVCGVVCPTRAIATVELDRKKLIKVGNATFTEDRCVVVTNGTACGACAEVCPTYAVRMVPYKDGLDLPETHEEYCIGCGNCEYACPVNPDKAIYVVGETLHSVVEKANRPALEEVFGDDDTGNADAKKDTEFPF
jgi:ferredoxin